MKKNLSLLLLLLAAGCEILEENISDQHVQVIGPADKAVLGAGSVDFRWESTPYATGYEFRAVSPSFAAAANIVADTVIFADSLSRSYGCRIQLAAGKYEWSVAGFNNGYRTRTEIRSLTILPPEEQSEPSEIADP